MSTRSVLVFVVDGRELVTYTHSDGYPSGVGADVLDWARGVQDWDAVTEQARALIPVEEDGVPSNEQLEELTRRGMEGGEDWYWALRENQGNPEGILRSGYITDYSAYGRTDTSCEYAWVIDLDRREFRGHKGNLSTTPTVVWPFDRLLSDFELVRTFGEA